MPRTLATTALDRPLSSSTSAGPAATMRGVLPGPDLHRHLGSERPTSGTSTPARAPRRSAVDRAHVAVPRADHGTGRDRVGDPLGDLVISARQLRRAGRWAPHALRQPSAGAGHVPMWTHRAEVLEAVGRATGHPELWRDALVLAGQPAAGDRS